VIEEMKIKRTKVKTETEKEKQLVKLQRKKDAFSRFERIPQHERKLSAIKMGASKPAATPAFSVVSWNFRGLLDRRRRRL
jgi:hypothetical protein